jgi:hypothetical protein
MTETGMCGTPLLDCEMVDGLFLSLEHSSFEFVSDFDLPAVQDFGRRVLGFRI